MNFTTLMSRRHVTIADLAGDAQVSHATIERMRVGQFGMVSTLAQVLRSLNRIQPLANDERTYIAGLLIPQ